MEGQFGERMQDDSFSTVTLPNTQYESHDQLINERRNE